MKSHIAVAFVAALALVPCWGKATTLWPKPEPVAPPPLTAPPWVTAQVALDDATADLQQGGIRALAAHVDALEKALADAGRGWLGASPDETVVLTDGMADMLLETVAAGKAAPDKTAVAINDPFAPIALYLASYYNETGRFEDAVRVIDREFAFHPGTTGGHRPELASERAVALVQLHRFAEALKAYDDGLLLLSIDDKGKARMQRGRGYALTELGRLDDAEAAYRQSLTLEPNNKLALGELAYIAKLKAGAKPEAK